MNVQNINLDLSKAIMAGQIIRMGQGDSDGTTIRATILDNSAITSLSGMSATFCMRLPDGIHYVRDANCTISGNVITYVVDEEHCCSVAGYTDEAYFEVADGSNEYSTSRFRVKVERSAIDGAEPSESWDNAVDELIRRGNSQLNVFGEAEAIRQSNEGTRQSSETTRQSNETTRQTNENTRQTNENTRKSNETARVSAENARVTAENGRVTAENSRVTAESGRVTAENARVTAENARVTAETEREKKVISSASVSVDANVGTPSATVSLGSPATGGRNIAFDFKNLKGEGGKITGVTATVDDQVGTPTVEVSTGGTDHERTISLAFHNLKGVPGDGADVAAITNAQIDSITSDVSVTSTNVLKATGLTYLWGKIKSKFAALSGGFVPVSQGGTGKGTHTSNAVLTGNGANAVNNVSTASGAFYATSANGAAQFGTLPTAQGGTGATTAAGAAENIVDGQALAPASVAATGEVSAVSGSVTHKLTDKAESGAIAYVESTTATKNHAVGERFILNGVLRRATSAIAAGETISDSNSTPSNTTWERIDALSVSKGKVDPRTVYAFASSTAIAAGSYVESTIDISSYGYTSTPLVLGDFDNFCFTDMVSRSATSVTVRVYNLSGASRSTRGPMYLIPCI